MTPVMPEGEPTVCRLYSIPVSLVGNWDGAVGLLCSPHLWTRGDDPLSASVADTNAAYAAIIEDTWERGCGMVGEIIEIATADVPAWALPCDGTEYANVDYPELAAVIHPGLIVDGSHFRTPDRQSRFGLDGQIVGAQGGEATHTLTSGEMPGHDHLDLGHQHTEVIPLGEGVAFTPGELPVVIAQSASLTGIASANIQSSGGGGAHNNMPPWEGTQFVIVAMSQ